MFKQPIAKASSPSLFFLLTCFPGMVPATLMALETAILPRPLAASTAILATMPPPRRISSALALVQAQGRLVEHAGGWPR